MPVNVRAPNVAVTVTDALGMVKAQGLLLRPPVQLAPAIVQPLKLWLPSQGVAVMLTALPTAGVVVPVGTVLPQPLLLTVNWRGGGLVG